MRFHLVLMGVLASSTIATAQINQFVGVPPAATNFLDFDAPFVASGPISSTDPAFTGVGISSVAILGTSWTISGDTITATSNASGQSLVGTSNGAATLSVAGVGQALSNTGTGGGFDVQLAADASQFGVLFIDQINFSYSIELLDNGASLGTGTFSYSGSFPSPAHYWTGPGAFDQIKIVFLSSVGVGIDNFAFDVSASAPVTYCTPGTSTNGCLASIGASAQPSVTQANACTISVATVEGQKSGLIFYGIDNSGFTPTSWGVGGLSFLCVKAPAQRTTSQSSGGTVGLCDGSLTLDWDAFQLANPSALGNPWSAGADVFVQGWYRDPPAVKTTNLSDAVRLTYAP